MRVGHIELFVRDMARARRFWEGALGVEVAEEQAGGEFLWLESGDLEILLRPGEPPASPATYQGAPLGLVIYTDDLDAALARLAENGVLIEGDDGGCPAFRDPDGRWFQIVNPEEHSS